MQAGIFSRNYALNGVALFERIRADGFSAAQFNLVNVGLDSLPLALPEAALAEAKAQAVAAGVGLVALSGTYNMVHPDPVQRAAMRPRFQNVCRAARLLGIPVVTLCTGSRDASNMWAHHAENASPAAMKDFRGELDFALEAASGLTLAVEPEPGNVIADVKVARGLLDAVNSPRLKIILDAANLLSPGTLARQRTIMDEAFDLLGADIVLAHGKDIDAQGRVVPPGMGAVDLAHFVKGLRAAKFSGPLIGHGFEARDAPQAAAAFKKLLAEAA